jgi:DNA-binding LacI/PurR family transcriptional regulator
MPNATERTRIAAHAIVSVRPVERIYQGSPSTSTTRARIEQAALALKLPLPPQPASANAA